MALDINSVTTQANSIMFTLAIMLVLVVIGIFIFWVMYSKSFKHLVTIKELVNNRKRIIITKGRNKKIDGVEYWQLWDAKKKKGSEIISIPESSCIEITKSGKLYAEFYKDQYNNYYPIHDPNNFKEPPKELYTLSKLVLPKEIEDKINLEAIDKEGLFDSNIYNRLVIEEKIKYRDSQLKLWMKENNSVTPIKPFTQNQKIAQVNLHKRKLALTGKSLSALIQQGILIGGILMMLAILVFGYSEIVAPSLEAKALDIQITANQLDIMNKYDELINNKQILLTENGQIKPKEAPN